MNIKKVTLLLLTFFIVLTTVSAISAANNDSSSITDDSQTASVDIATVSSTSSSDDSSSSSLDVSSSSDSSSSSVSTTTSTSKSVDTQKSSTISSSSSDKASLDSSSSSSTKVSTDTSSQSTTTQSSSEKVSTETTTTNSNESQNIVNDNSDKNTVKTSTVDSKEDTKTAMTHVINNDNVGEFFDLSEGSNGALTDLVQDGDTLDIQGTINLTDHSLTINKPVNIISTTNDGTITLNTVAGSYFGENPGSSFVINREGSYTNVTGVNFYNSQLWIYNTTHVTLDNISAIVDSVRVGSGIGQTSIRANSTYVTIKNSLISTTDNGGSSSLVLAYANYCTVDNCTIIGTGSVGNLLYINTYNVDLPSDGFYNQYNNLTNNRLIGPESAIATCYAIRVDGSNNLFENNTIEYVGQNFVSAGSNNTYINNVCTQTSTASLSVNSTVINNTFGSTAVPANAYFEGNTVYNITAVAGNATVLNNTIQQSLSSTSTSLSYANGSIINNTVYGNVHLSNNYTVSGNTVNGNLTLNSSSKATNLVNNTINGVVTVLGSGNNIEGNTVTTSDLYAVNVTADNNTVINNILIANTYSGNNAVITNATNVTIEGNTPEANTILITNTTYSDYFDDNGELKVQLDDYSILMLSGEITDKNFVFTNEIVALQSEDENTILKGVTITSKDNARITLQDLKINNTGYDIESAIIFESDLNVIDGCDIYYYTETTNAMLVVFEGDENKIVNSNVSLYGISDDIDYTKLLQIAPTTAIAVFSSGNLINNNNITTSAVVEKSTDGFGSLYSVTLQQNNTDDVMENNTITNNNIKTEGIDYAYGINLLYNSNNNNITSNTINTTSERYANGIRFQSDPANNNIIVSNKINVTANDLGYGIIFSAYRGDTEYNNNISSNTVVVNANQGYGLDIYTSNSQNIQNTTVRSNTFTITGDYSMGVGLYQVTNITIASNTFNIVGTTNETDETSYDFIKPTTAGIVLMDCGDTVNISSNSRINVTNGVGIKVINTNNVNISSNNINTTNSVSVYFNSSDNAYMYSNTILSDKTGILIENSNSNNISANKVNSTDETYTVVIDNTSTENIVSNNTFFSRDNTGNLAVNSENSDNTVFFNGPADILLTDDNFYTYFDENGILKDEYTTLNTTIVLGSDIYNKDMTFTCNVTFNNTGNFTIYDSTLTLRDNITNSYTYIYYLNMNCTDGRESVIILDTLKSWIQYSNIYQYNENTGARTIYATENGSLGYLYNNNITVYGAELKTDDGTPSLAILYEVSNQTQTVNVGQSASSNGGNLYIEAITSDGEGTTCGMYTFNRTTYTNFYYFNLTVKGINNAVGIDSQVAYLYLGNVTVSSQNKATGYKLTNQTSTSSNAVSSYSNIIVTAPNEAIGIDVVNSLTFYTQYSNITVNSNNTAIGIKATNATRSSTSQKLTYNNITVTGSDVIGIYLDNAPLNITVSNITVIGTTAQAIVYENGHDESLNLNISSNRILVNTTNPTVAIELTNMTDLIFRNNTVETNSDSEYILTLTDSNNVNITNNSLSKDGFRLGDSAVEVKNSENVIVQDNPQDVLELTVTTVETTKVGDTITLTAELNDKAINDGYVIFKVNGKTLKDANGNVVEVPVIDGVATYNYTVPATSSSTYIVSSVYNGEYGVVRSENTTFTAEPTTANIELTTTGTLMPGQTVTLTAYITDENNNAVTSGRVVFKLNGVSLKDAEGNVIYAYVDENGIASINYTIPSNFSAKDYTLTAVFQANGFERTETNETITITKIDTTVSVDSSIIDTTTNTITITQGENLQLKATIIDQSTGNAVTGTTKIAVKINEKTVVQEYVTDGVIDLTIYTSSFKNPTYSIEIIAGENSQYNKSSYNGTLSVLEPNSLLIKETSYLTTKTDKTATNSENYVINNDKSLKADPITHVVTNDNLGYFFDLTESSGHLTDLVIEGDTLDIQGTINLTNQSLTINKPVNIISTTNDAVISLNTIAGSYEGEDPGSSFIINNEGSYTNVTGIRFYNSQIWVYNTSYVTIDNISVYVINQRVGSGNGHTSIREGSEFVTLKNSYFYTEDNGQSSSVVLANANNCTVDNCTIVGSGDVGNLLYITTYNVGINDDKYNCGNKLTNNVLIGPETPTNVCWGIVLSGEDNLIENNTVNYTGVGITVQNNANGLQNNVFNNNVVNKGATSTIPTYSIAKNNTFSGPVTISQNSTFTNNTLTSANITAGVLFEDNIVGNITSIGGNSTVNNNTISGSVTLTSSTLAYANSTLSNNTIGGTVSINNNMTITDNTIYGTVTLNSSSKSTVFANNTVINATVEVIGSGNTIDSNNINNYELYTVNVTGTDNKVINNTLISSTNIGDNTVVNTTEVTLEDNKPVSQSTITVTNDTYSDYFDSNGELITGVVEDYGTIILSGEITDKNFTFTNSIVNIKSEDENTILKNVIITSKDSAYITIDGVTINNTGYDIESTIIFLSDYNTLIDSNIYYETTMDTITVYVSGKNNKIVSNNIQVAGPSGAIDYTKSVSIAPTVAVGIFSGYNIVKDNVITTTVSEKRNESYDTIESITLQPLNSGDLLEYNTITGNTITTIGSSYAYSINLLNNTNYNNISNNSITTEATSSATGIQFGSDPASNNNITFNNITLKADDDSYGIIFSAYNYGDVKNNRITNNTINATSTYIYLIEVYDGSESIDNTTIASNTLYGNGNYTMGIGIYKTYNTNITRNNITLNATTNVTVASADYILPTTAGIYIKSAQEGLILTGNAKINMTNGPGIVIENTDNLNITNNTVYNNNSVGIVLNTTSNSNITNNTVTGNETGIFVNGTNNYFTTNKINSTQVSYTIELDSESTNNIITNNTLISKDNTADDTVLNPSDNSVYYNNPIIIALTDDNYSTYFDDQSTLKEEYLSANTTITLASDIHNKDLIIPGNFTFNNTENKYTIYNGTITIIENSIVVSTSNTWIYDLKMNSTDGRESLLIVDSKNVRLTNSTFYQYNENTAARTIFVTENGSITNMINATITTYGAEIKTDDESPSLAMIYDLSTSGINTWGSTQYQPAGNFYLEAVYTDNEGTTAGFYSRARSDSTNFQYANMTVKGLNKAIGIYREQTTVQYSNIVVSSNNEAYGLRFENNSGTSGGLNYNTNLTVTAPNTAIGVQLINSKPFSQISNSTIIVNSNGTSKTIEARNSTNRSSSSYKFTRSVLNVTGVNSTAIDLDGNPADINNTTIYVTGVNAVAIIDMNAEYSTTNVINISSNRIYVNTTDPTNAVIIENLTRLIFKNNTIETNSNAEYVITITDSTDVNVTDNNISTNGFLIGNRGVEVTNSENVIVEDNPSDELILTVTTVETTKVGSTIILTAELNDKSINDGYVIFKVNGKTFKDASGNVVEVPVIDGVATYNYTVPAISSDTYTASAVYNGEYGVVRSENTTFTATPTTANIELTTTGTLMPGQTVTLTANITDESGNAVTSGKVVFKLNGVSLKDAEGNVIYAYVDENGIASINYTIPSNFSAKDYTLTAVFQATGFERTEINDTITISKIDTSVSVDSSIIDTTTNTITITQGENLQLKATITDETGNTVSGTTKVAVKINEKTVVQQYVTDGVIDLTIYTSSFKNPTYSIEIIAGENSQYNKSTYNGTLSVLEPNSLLINETSNNGTLLIVKD